MLFSQISLNVYSIIIFVTLHNAFYSPFSVGLCIKAHYYRLNNPCKRANAYRGCDVSKTQARSENRYILASLSWFLVCFSHQDLTSFLVEVPLKVDRVLAPLVFKVFVKNKRAAEELRPPKMNHSGFWLNSFSLTEPEHATTREVNTMCFAVYCIILRRSISSRSENMV